MVEFGLASAGSSRTGLADAGWAFVASAAVPRQASPKLAQRDKASNVCLRVNGILLGMCGYAGGVALVGDPSGKHGRNTAGFLSEFIAVINWQERFPKAALARLYNYYH